MGCSGSHPLGARQKKITSNIYGTFRHRVVDHPTVRFFTTAIFGAFSSGLQPVLFVIPDGIMAFRDPNYPKNGHKNGHISAGKSSWSGISRVVKRMSSGSIRPKPMAQCFTDGIFGSLDVRWCKFSVSWEPLMSDEQCSKPWLGSSSGIIPNILGITIQERGIPFLVLNRCFMIFHGMTFQDLNTAQSAHLEIYSRKDKFNIRWTIPIHRIRWFPH